MEKIIIPKKLNKTTFFTVLGYDMARLIVKVLQSNPEARNLKFIRSAKKLNYFGVLGKMKFDKLGHTIKPFHVFSMVLIFSH